MVHQPAEADFADAEGDPADPRSEDAAVSVTGDGEIIIYRQSINQY